MGVESKEQTSLAYAKSYWKFRRTNCRLQMTCVNSKGARPFAVCGLRTASLLQPWRLRRGEFGREKTRIEEENKKPLKTELEEKGGNFFSELSHRFGSTR